MGMTDAGHIYIAIDLKSFYASVECVERSLDPLVTNLVVADAGRGTNFLDGAMTRERNLQIGGHKA